jgi:hypothetical protein
MHLSRHRYGSSVSPGSLRPGDGERWDDLGSGKDAQK